MIFNFQCNLTTTTKNSEKFEKGVLKSHLSVYHCKLRIESYLIRVISIKGRSRSLRQMTWWARQKHHHMLLHDNESWRHATIHWVKAPNCLLKDQRPSCRERHQMAKAWHQPHLKAQWTWPKSWWLKSVIFYNYNLPRYNGKQFCCIFFLFRTKVLALRYVWAFNIE